MELSQSAPLAAWARGWRAQRRRGWRRRAGPPVPIRDTNGRAQPSARERATATSEAGAARGGDGVAYFALPWLATAAIFAAMSAASPR